MMSNKDLTGRDGDTIKLLRECDAGVKMGVASIKEVISDVLSDKLKNLLNDSKEQHEKLAIEIEELLDDHNDDGKEPNPMAKGMSWIKTNVKMMTDPSDATIADLMTDGCNMGVKSLNRYLNQYESADSNAKDIARRLVQIESRLSNDLADYL